MTSDASWAAVIVNHNGGVHLARCVDALLEDASGGTPEIVVVDNASSDESHLALERARPEVLVVRAPGNVGYARGANLGIAATRAPTVAVLNPDTVVPPGTAAAMLDALSRPDVGAVGPRVVNPDGSDYPSARTEPGLVDAAGHGLLGLVWPRNPFTRRYRQLDEPPDVARDVDWVSGCAVWLRRAALDGVGGWDERYFMYMEDVDLGARLREAGWRVRYEPSARILHVQGASTSQRPYRMLLEHHRSILRYRALRSRGWRRALLPAIAAALTLRAAVAIGRHAAASLRPGNRPPTG